MRSCELLKKKLQTQHTMQRPPSADQPRRNRAYDKIESRLYNNTESYVQKITQKAPPSDIDDGQSAPVVPTAEDLPRFRASSLGPIAQTHAGPSAKRPSGPGRPPAAPTPPSSALGQAAQASAAASAAAVE